MWSPWVDWLLSLIAIGILVTSYIWIYRSTGQKIKKQLKWALPMISIAVFLLIINNLSSIESHGKEVYFGSLVTLFCYSLIGTVIYFWRDSLNFMKNLRRIRKTYYVMYFVIMAIGYVTGYVDINDWKFLTQFTAFIVFLDLAIFQTPSINKIWNTEFQQEDSIRKTIEENDALIANITKKIDALEEIIDKTETYFEPIVTPSDWDGYKTELLKYLNMYGSKFNFDIALFLFHINATDVEETKNNVLLAMRGIELYHTHTFKDYVPKDSLEKDRNQIAIDFTNRKPHVIKPDKVFAAPFIGKRAFIITVASAGYVAVNPVDGSHLLSLARITEWYLK